MRKRSIDAELRRASWAEEQTRNQAPAANTARFLATARVESSKGNIECVGGQVPVTAEETASALPEIRNDNDVSLLISRAGFQPCFPLAHVIGCSKICVSVASADLQPAELVDQEKID